MRRSKFFVLDLLFGLTELSFHLCRIGTVVAVTTGLFAWLLWLCCWMHQWHPLITPEWMSDDE